MAPVNFASTTGDSCSHPPSLLGDLIESARVPIQHGLLAGVLLPAAAYDIDILRIEFHAETDASCLLSRDESCPATEETVVNRLSRKGVV